MVFRHDLLVFLACHVNVRWFSVSGLARIEVRVRCFGVGDVFGYGLLALRGVVLIVTSHPALGSGLTGTCGS